MKKIVYALFATVALTGQIHALTPSEEEFIKKYSVDETIARILDQHSEEIEKGIIATHHTHLQKHGVWKFDWLPGYYIKYNLARIRGMEKMNLCIKKNNLHLLRVAEKQIYHIKGRPQDLHNLNYAIVIKAVEEDPTEATKPLTLEHVQQLCTIIEKTGYISMTNTNYIRGKKGMLTMIDTEATFDYSKLILAYIRMIGARHNLNKDYTQDALTFILNKMARSLDYMRKPEQNSSLRSIYKFFDDQPRPLAWDYVTYFKNLLQNQ